jgi:hypothetical protein
MDRATFTGVLALILTLGFFAFLAALLFVQVPEGNAEMLFTAGGVLFGGANLAWGFYLGSSIREDAKTPPPAT